MHPLRGQGEFFDARVTDQKMKLKLVRKTLSALADGSSIHNVDPRLCHS